MQDFLSPLNTCKYLHAYDAKFCNATCMHAIKLSYGIAWPISHNFCKPSFFFCVCSRSDATKVTLSDLRGQKSSLSIIVPRKPSSHRTLKQNHSSNNETGFEMWSTAPPPHPLPREAPEQQEDLFEHCEMRGSRGSAEIGFFLQVVVVVDEKNNPLDQVVVGGYVDMCVLRNWGDGHAHRNDDE